MLNSPPHPRVGILRKFICFCSHWLRFLPIGDILAIVIMFLLSHWLTNAGKSSICHNFNQWEQKQVNFLSISTAFWSVDSQIFTAKDIYKFAPQSQDQGKLQLLNYLILWFFWAKLWYFEFFDSLISAGDIFNHGFLWFFCVFFVNLYITLVMYTSDGFSISICLFVSRKPAFQNVPNLFHSPHSFWEMTVWIKLVFPNIIEICHPSILNGFGIIFILNSEKPSIMNWAN